LTPSSECVASGSCRACHAEAVRVPLAAPLAHYVVIRKDLPLGILAAQLVHAAGESSPGNLPPGTHAIVLEVPDEPALAALGRRLVLAGVAHVRIVEDAQPWTGQLMALGLVPVPREEVRRRLSSLPLLRE